MQAGSAAVTSGMAGAVVRMRMGCCWDAGYKERFGEDIHERLEREGQIQVVWPNSRNPDVDAKFIWMLTKEVWLAICGPAYFS